MLGTQWALHQRAKASAPKGTCSYMWKSKARVSRGAQSCSLINEAGATQQVLLPPASSLSLVGDSDEELVTRPQEA